jgi:hypothetical protein
VHRGKQQMMGGKRAMKTAKRWGEKGAFSEVIKYIISITHLYISILKIPKPGFF